MQTTQFGRKRSMALTMALIGTLSMFAKPQPKTDEPPAPAAENTGTETAAPVLTPQEKIDQFNQEYQTKWADMIKLSPMSKEAHVANAELWKLQKSIEAQQALIDKAANEAKIAEEKNARVKMLVDLVDTAIAEGKETDNYKAQYEKVANELLAKYPASSPAKSAGAATGTKGATGQAIVEAYKAERAKPLDHTQALKNVIAQGFSRGTSGAVVLAYRKEIGEVS